jgi:hypothetical protein
MSFGEIRKNQDLFSAIGELLQIVGEQYPEQYAWVLNCSADHKVPMVKFIREVLGYGLKEALDMVNTGLSNEKSYDGRVVVLTNMTFGKVEELKIAIAKSKFYGSNRFIKMECL